MIYLCSVYSHGKGKKSKRVRKRRYELAKKFVASNPDKFFYSPIVYFHQMAEEYDFPKDYEFWKKRDRDMIRRCDKVLILDVVNEPNWDWDKSEGIQDEATFAMECGIPVHRVPFYAEDRDLPEDLKKAVEEANKKNEELDGKPH